MLVITLANPRRQQIGDEYAIVGTANRGDRDGTLEKSAVSISPGPRPE